MCLMLRACAQLKLELESQGSEDFLKILVGISSTGSVFNEDKSQEQWEKQMMLSWERLCESRENKQLFKQVPEA